MADTRPISVPTKPAVQVAPPAWWPCLAFGVGSVVYLCLFYGVNDKRSLVLPFLLAPDLLATTWVGHDWSRFAPADHLLVLLPALLILGLAFLAGRLALDLLRVDRALTRLERFVFSTAVGMNLWSLFTLAVGLAGGLQQRWVFALAAAAVLAFSGARAARWRAAAPPVGAASGSNWLVRMSGALAVPFALMIVWGATLPSQYFDVREYHLQVPKEWFLAGRVSFLPHNVYGNMPLGAGMYAILGMVMSPGPDGWWWGSLIGKTVIGLVAPLTALAIYAGGQRLFSSVTAGAAAACVFLTTPWTAHVSMNGLIDLVSALYMLLAIYAVLLRSAPSPDPRQATADPRRLVGLSGFLAGSGVACKYPAVLFLVVPLFCVIVVPPWRKDNLRCGIVFVCAVLLGCGLWLGKNWVLAGNPTYPLLYRWLDGRSWTAERDVRWTKAHGAPQDGEGRSYSLPQLLDSLQLIGVKSDFLGPALWPLAVLACASRRHRGRVIALVGFMLWPAAVWWFATHRLDRFLVPLLPLAALLAGLGAEWAMDRPAQWIASLLLAWNAANAFLFAATPLAGDPRFLVSLRDLRTDSPWKDTPEMSRIHPAHRYLNAHVPADHRALLVGEAQVFDLEVPILYNTCFDECNFERLMRGKSRDERRAALRAERISHIFFYWRELDRYRSPGNYGYSEFPTRELVRHELAEQQQLLRRVPLDLDPENGEIYEVVGSDHPDGTAQTADPSTPKLARPEMRRRLP